MIKRETNTRAVPEVPEKFLEVVVKDVQCRSPTVGISSLFLPAASLLEGQVDDSTTGHVVVSQGVGILDENAFIL